MKKRSLSKNRFIIYYQLIKNQPGMGRGTFMPEQHNYRVLGLIDKKNGTNIHAHTLGAVTDGY
jgi:hypothetical protein